MGESTVNLTPLLLMRIADSLPVVYIQELMWTVCVGINGTLGRRCIDGRSFAGKHEMIYFLHMCTYVRYHLTLLNYVMFVAEKSR